MPFNGSGGTTQPGGSIYPAVGSTLIESAKANVSIADIYVMLGTCLLKDGQQTATQRIPFASGVQTDTVTELTSDTGVTLDSVLLKDGRIDTTQGADIVCAATINLETATGNVVDVTGSTGPVTAVTLSQGHWRIVRFTGTPTLTHGASLVLPGAANIVVAAGDYALFIGYATSVVRCWYMKGDGSAIVATPFVDTNPIVVGSGDATKKVRFEVDGLTTGNTRVITMPDANVTLPTTNFNATQTANTIFAGPASGSAAAPTFRAPVGLDGASVVLLATGTASNSAVIDFTAISSTYDIYMVDGIGVVPATDGAGLTLRFSIDGGSTFKAGASDYVYGTPAQDQANASNETGSAAATFILISGANGSSNTASNGGVNFRMVLFNLNSTTQRKHVSFVGTQITAAVGFVGFAGGGASLLAGLTTDNVDAIRFIMGSGNITSGTFYLYGMRKA